MTSGIVHDFNNLLTGIVGQTALALANLPPENAARKYIERVEKAAEYASTLTNQLLQFASNQHLTIELTDINKMIRENASLFCLFLDQNVEIKYELGEKIPPVVMIRSQIQQVLMNLIVNAVEAIGERTGQITIRTTDVEITTSNSLQDITGRCLLAGHYICIEVDDNGCGMDDVTLSSVFAPFFTTKPRGNGLGLTTSLDIVLQHQGHLSINSKVGWGTRAIVYLPTSFSVSHLQ